MQQELTKKNTLPSGDLLEQRLVDAGFVDIQTFKEKLYVGDWAGGCLNIITN